MSLDDLRDENGNIDARRVANGHHATLKQGPQTVTARDCYRLRVAIRYGMGSEVHREAAGMAANTAHRHATGDCDHVEPVGAPPLAHGWHVPADADRPEPSDATPATVGPTVSPAECREIRRRLLSGHETVADLCAHYGAGDSTIRHHATGRCQHTGSVSHPPIAHGWHVAEGVADD